MNNSNNSSPKLKRIVAAPNESTVPNSYSVINVSSINNVSAKGKSNSYKLSEEFRVFWGSALDVKWFDRKKLHLPFLGLIISLTCLLLYLCCNLLYSPREVYGIFAANDQSRILKNKQIQEIQDNINHFANIPVKEVDETKEISETD